MDYQQNVGHHLIPSQQNWGGGEGGSISFQQQVLIVISPTICPMCRVAQIQIIFRLHFLFFSIYIYKKNDQ